MYKIDQDIIDKATKCDKEFACLKESCHPSCKVSDCINYKVHFIEKLDRHCPYFVHFGFSTVCTCPVRKEIFNIYGK